MAVGSGAPPVYSQMLELGRVPDAVPSENVVVRLDVREDGIIGGGSVADVLSTSEVPSSDVVGEAEEESDDSGLDEDDPEEDEVEEDETGPAEESAALLDGGPTLD